METNAIQGGEKLRGLLLRHGARCEISPYYVVLDVRTFGVPPVQRKVQAGFDVDLYGIGAGHHTLSVADGEFEEVLQELEEACREAVPPGAESCRIEIIRFEETLVLSVQQHFEPQALVRVRVTHSRGLDQPSGPAEDQALAAIVRSLADLGVRKT
jgi:hypothetical protein